MTLPHLAPALAVAALGALGALALFAPLSGQEEGEDEAPADPAPGDVPSVDPFDPARAILNDAPWFDPFRVTTMESLAEVLEEGRVTEETPLLVLERGGRHLALSTMQMSYHHVAQGKMAGEPWLVTF